MANKYISDLTATSTLSGSDVFELDNGTNSRKITATNMISALQAIGGPMSFAWPDRGPGSANGAATPCLGVYFTPVVNMTVAGLWSTVTTVAGATYRVAIYDVTTGGVINSVVVDSADIATPGAVTGTTLGANFATAATLTAGSHYVAAFRRTDSLDTTVVGVWGIATATLPTYSSLPTTFTSTEQTKYAVIAKKNPAAADTFTLTGAGYYSIGFRYWC